MKTVIHTYCFDLTEPAEKDAWHALRAKLSAMGLKCFHTWGGESHYRPSLDGKTITLETKHLFRDQWNTAPVPGVSDKGLRVFDWARDYMISGAKIARGHWIEQTPEMAEVRRNTVKCGYCGAQEPAAKGYVFCPHCLDSQYLEESDLHLTRMVSIDETYKPRAELTEAERAHLMPLFVEAQTHGTSERGKARLAAERRKLRDEYESTMEHALTKRDGFLWLLDHGIKTDNVIYYSHTGRFCFGWRKPLSPAEKSALVDVTVEFPFDYDIKEA